MSMIFKGRKRHRCFDWCGQQILGIEENQRLTNPDFNPRAVIEMRCRRPLLAGPGYTVVCRHGRSFYLRQVV